MIVHRGWGDDERTVADVVRDEIIGAPVFGLHRLDRGTSGVLLFGLNADVARHIQAEMNAKRFDKTYIALVRGLLTEPCVLNHPVKLRETGERVDAVTEFIPLEHQGRWSLVLAKPITGRPHQIRLHLKHLAHPIIGDVRYGKGDINRQFRTEYGLARLALHALELRFNDMKGESQTVRAQLPPDLQTPLSNIGLTLEPLNVYLSERGTYYAKDSCNPGDRKQ